MKVKIFRTDAEVLKMIPALLLFLFLPWNPLQAQAANPARQYRECMTLAREKPQQGFDMALGWRGLGGGSAAEHCLATSLIGLGQYREAAGRLEKLARKAREDTSVKAGLLAHSAQAWLLADQPARAEAVLNAALKLTPHDSALLVDRAEARAGQKNYDAALADLNKSIEQENRRPDAFVFRAATYRFLGKPDLALADVERALALQPNHSEALLERGILKRLKGDDKGARLDWLKVLGIAPGSPAAISARQNLENMDVKTGN